MDDWLRRVEREFKESPTIENYQIYLEALARNNLPKFCYFCGVSEQPEFDYGGDLISCSCGALFCEDCGLNYACGEGGCNIGYCCPGCLDKCPRCNGNICPGTIHETTCGICNTEYCLRCVEENDALTRCHICNTQCCSIIAEDSDACIDWCNDCHNMVCRECTDKTEEEWICTNCADN